MNTFPTAAIRPVGQLPRGVTVAGPFITEPGGLDMAKPWTMSDDIFLLTHHRNVCPNYIASHDLGRPHGAGKARLAILTKSGARLELSRAQMHLCDYALKSGVVRAAFDREVAYDSGEYWRTEIAELEKAGA